MRCWSVSSVTWCAGRTTVMPTALLVAMSSAVGVSISGVLSARRRRLAQVDLGVFAVGLVAVLVAGLRPVLLDDLLAGVAALVDERLEGEVRVPLGQEVPGDDLGVVGAERELLGQHLADVVLVRLEGDRRVRQVRRHQLEWVGALVAA